MSLSRICNECKACVSKRKPRCSKRRKTEIEDPEPAEPDPAPPPPPPSPAPTPNPPCRAKVRKCRRARDTFLHMIVSVVIWVLIILAALHYKKMSPADVYMEGVATKMKEMSDRFFRSFVTVKSMARQSKFEIEDRECITPAPPSNPTLTSSHRAKLTSCKDATDMFYVYMSTFVFAWALIIILIALQEVRKDSRGK
uniref:Uncharacterized protein n=1 Tax=Glossina brevipalpis TaxID=37001 RepID=A0A1A9WMC4_9MUSC